MATRTITSATLAAATAKQKTALIFIELDFASGFVRVCNAFLPSVPWNSKTWIGVGALGAVEQARETLGIEAIALNFRLTGINTAYVATALGENYQGRAGRMWVGFISGGAIVVDPFLVFSGRMDTMTITDGPDAATIAVDVESKLATWSIPKIRRFSDADQQAEFPGDLGLQYIAEMTSGLQTKWGAN